MPSFLTDAKEKYINLRGYHTKHRFVIIESDDWGSIRMPSYETFLKLQQLGDEPQKDAFLRNDCLENDTDLINLFEVLESVKDVNGNHPIITANFAMANPDFDNINYNKGIYNYEPFYKTYTQYYPNNNILGLLKNGIDRKVIYPQLHCREHLNVNRWMNDLNKGKSDVITAFNNKMIGISASFSKNNVFGYMDAFNTDSSSTDELYDILKEADRIFQNTFGYKSLTFVASCFVWNDKFESLLNKLGVVGIQTSAWQNYAVGEEGTYKLRRKIHYTGQCNKFKQIYTVRNCAFEPAYTHEVDLWVNKCFNEVKKSFKYDKPAIINSHRLNYIGSINPNNSKNNLIGLKQLLDKIINSFDNVEFISTSQLIDFIRKGELKN